MKGNKTYPFYTDEMKMAELLLEDYWLLSVMDRIGIRLGFGEATVAEVCKQYGISSHLFLTLCNIYSFPHYEPDLTLLDTTDLADIVRYLKASHQYYIREHFPLLHRNIHIMVENCDSSNRLILNKFYDDYDTEISKHFSYEDEVVFPYVESLLRTQGVPEDRIGPSGTSKKEKLETTGTKKSRKKYSISEFERSHSDIEEKLHDLKNIIIKYLPEAKPMSARLTVLFAIFHIEKDLAKHSLMENRLLIPMVSALEKAQQ